MARTEKIEMKQAKKKTQPSWPSNPGAIHTLN